MVLLDTRYYLPSETSGHSRRFTSPHLEQQHIFHLTVNQANSPVEAMSSALSLFFKDLLCTSQHSQPNDDDDNGHESDLSSDDGSISTRSQSRHFSATAKSLPISAFRVTIVPDNAKLGSECSSVDDDKKSRVAKVRSRSAPSLFGSSRSPYFRSYSGSVMHLAKQWERRAASLDPNNDREIIGKQKSRWQNGEQPVSPLSSATGSSTPTTSPDLRMSLVQPIRRVSADKDAPPKVVRRKCISVDSIKPLLSVPEQRGEDDELCIPPMATRKTEGSGAGTDTTSYSASSCWIFPRLDDGADSHSHQSRAIYG